MASLTDHQRRSEQPTTIVAAVIGRDRARARGDAGGDDPAATAEHQQRHDRHVRVDDHDEHGDDDHDADRLGRRRA